MFPGAHVALFLMAGIAAAPTPSAAAVAPTRPLDALVRDPEILFLGEAAVDPLKELPVAPQGLAELEGLAPRIPPGAVPDEIISVVQAAGIPAAELARRLEAAAFQVIGFVPNAGYLVRLPSSKVETLRSMQGVRWAGEYRAAWKVDAVLADLVAQDDARSLASPLRLRVVFHAGSSADLHRDELAAVPGGKVLDVHPDEQLASALLEIAPGHLRAAVVHLAALRDVARVAHAPVPRPHLDHASWFVQTGDDVVGATNLDVSAKLFARGLTGRGILVSLIDDGLENDHCQFVYGNATDEAAWPLGPTADAPGSVPPEGGPLGAGSAPVRTRDRRVVAYYVQAGARAYSSSTQHGTMVAQAILGDDPTVLAARPLIRDTGDDQNVRPFRATGDWTLGLDLRPELAARVDDPTTDEPSWPNTYGQLVEHHQASDGIAPGAQLVFHDIGNADGMLTGTASVAAMLDQARRTGATVATLAFGGPPCDGCYIGDAQGVDHQAWLLRDLAVVASAGNDGMLGAGSISSGAAQSKSAISVGASRRANEPSGPGTPRLGESVATFSALGPSSGGRIAPEIMAPGLVVVRVADGAPIRPEDGTGSGDFACGDAVPSVVGGTSFAAGVIGGAAALVQQYFLDGFYPGGAPIPSRALRPTNALVRAVLANSARNLGGERTDDAHLGRADRPTFGQGWGAPRLDDTLFFSGDPSNAAGTERGRLLVLNDVPNGLDGASPLAPEPGGLTRDALLPSFRPAMPDRGIAEWFLLVNNTDPTLPANELRLTLAWSDCVGTSSTAPLVSNLDLEVISPGPDGLLQSVGVDVLGDDVVYRPHPASWSGGFTPPSSSDEVTGPANMATPFPDTDMLNTLENVFVRQDQAVTGTWRVRVIARRVPGTGGTNAAAPNFVFDQAPTLDTDGDGVPDMDTRDTIFADRQGYALIASGPITFTPPRVGPPRVPRGGGPRPPRDWRPDPPRH